MTLLYPNPCYNEVCYKVTALYFYFSFGYIHVFIYISINRPDSINSALTESLFLIPL